MSQPFLDHAALVTGASSGIGAAMAVELAGQGADVVLVARRAERLADVARAVHAVGRRAVVVAGDVRVRADVDRATAVAVTTFGRLDIVVANAGYGVIGHVDELAIEDLRGQFETNFFGVLHTVYATLPHLRASRGRLGIVGSVAGFVSVPRVGAYSASKFAVRAIAEALRNELAGDGVSVTHIAPGYVASEFRHKDNAERLDMSRPDHVPGWLVMPTAVAARHIVAALRRRKAEAIITRSGRLAVLLARVAPGAVRWVIGRTYSGR